MKNLYLALLLLSTILIACKKEKPVNTTMYTIKGKCFASCYSRIPQRSDWLSFDSKKPGSNEITKLGSLVTDSTGAFSFSYPATEFTENTITIRDVWGPVLNDVPVNKDIETEVYFENYTTIAWIKIKTQKPYTSNDTLYYSPDTLNPFKYKLIGPFKNNHSDHGFIFDNPNIYGKELPKTLFYCWKLGSDYYDPAKGNYVTTNLIPCSKNNEIVLDLTKSVK